MKRFYGLTGDESRELFEAVQLRLRKLRETAELFSSQGDAEGLGLCEVSRKWLLSACDKLALEDEGLR